MLWLIFTAVAFLVCILAWIFLDVMGFAIIVGLVMGTLGVIVLYRYAYVHLNEMEVGVIFNREGNFSRFLPPGHHFINPFIEYLDSTMTRGFQTSKSTARQIRTREGIPVDIQWDVSFSVDVQKIMPGIEHKMARALPKFAPNMVGGRVLHSLRHIVENMGIEELHTEGAIQRLEEAVRTEVFRRSAHLGIVEISANDMKLGPITMPRHVENALEANYERHLTVEALDKLQKVLAQFTEEHMEKLGELERLRILNNGDAQFYMMENVLK